MIFMGGSKIVMIVLINRIIYEMLWWVNKMYVHGGEDKLLRIALSSSQQSDKQPKPRTPLCTLSPEPPKTGWKCPDPTKSRKNGTF
jgi:hypothetical protein